MKKVKSVLIILLLVLLAFPIMSVGTVYAEDVYSGDFLDVIDRSSEPEIAPPDPEDKQPSKEQIWQKPIENNNEELNIEDSNDSDVWLYIGIGVGVVAVAVGAVFVVKAIKRKKEQW